MSTFFKRHFFTVNISPIMPMIILFIMGIIGAHMQITKSSYWGLICIFFSIYNTLYYNRSLYPFYYSATYIIIFISGACWYQKNVDDYNNFYIFTNNRPVNVTGHVVDLYENNSSYQKSLVVTLSSPVVEWGSETIQVNKKIIFHCSPKLDNIQVGDQITFYNALCKKPESDSFNAYQIKEQTIATVFNQKTDCAIVNRPTLSLRRFIFNHKQRIINTVEQKMSSDCFVFFLSLFLGNRMYVKNSIEKFNENFKQWGVYHLLARSGMHLALFIFIWQILFFIVPLNFMVKQIIIIILCLLYALLSWISAPFMRSLLLFILNRLCIITNNSYQLLHYLIITCFIFLLYCPLYIFFLDFQLSFGLTFALAWINQLYGHYFSEQFSKNN